MIRTFPRVLSVCLCLLYAGICAARAEWNVEEADAYLRSIKDKWKSPPYSDQASGAASNWIQLWLHLGGDPLELFCLRAECLPERPDSQGPVPLFSLEPAEKAKKMGAGWNESYVLTFQRVVLSPYFIAGFDKAELARLLPQKRSVEWQPEIARGKKVDCRDCHPDTNSWSDSLPSSEWASFQKRDFQPIQPNNQSRKDALSRLLAERSIKPYTLSRKDQPSWKSTPRAEASLDWFLDWTYLPKFGVSRSTQKELLQVIIEAPALVDRSVPATSDGHTQPAAASQQQNNPNTVKGMDE